MPNGSVFVGAGQQRAGRLNVTPFTLPPSVPRRATSCLLARQRQRRCSPTTASFVSSTVLSSLRSAFAIVLRYTVTVTVAGASPSSPFSSQSSSASFTV